MKKNFKILLSTFLLLFIFLTPYENSIFSTNNAKAAGTSLIDDYIKVTSVSKNGETITIKYKIKKNLPSYSYNFQSSWDVYGTPKTQKLKTKKGTYTATIKKTKTYVGPQKIKITATVASRYTQQKTIKTFYKLPADRIKTHTMSKKEAISNHLIIAGSINSIKFLKVGKKLTPTGIILDLTYAGLSSHYLLKSINVIEKGYPTPVAGQYTRIKTTYKKNEIHTNVKVWSNKESYKKGVKPSFNKTQINIWGKVR